MNNDDVKAEAVKAWARKIRHETTAALCDFMGANPWALDPRTANSITITWAGATTMPWLESALSQLWEEAYDAGRLREMIIRGPHDD